MTIRRSIDVSDGERHGPTRLRLTWAGLLSLAFSVIVVASAWQADSRLGAPQFWPWLLTGLQVLALWSAGSLRWWGWLLGASVQAPWIAYAVVTGQLGFIPGCAVSAAVQSRTFLQQALSSAPAIPPEN